jgi:hypothetical protein
VIELAISCRSFLGRGEMPVLATVKKRLSKTVGFLKSPCGGRDCYFDLAGFRKLPGQELSELPKVGELVEILAKKDTDKGPRAKEWGLP